MYQTIKPASVMVWAAVSKTWRSLLIFIDQSTKINAKYYVENILESMLKSAKDHFGNDISPCGLIKKHLVDISTGWCRVTHSKCCTELVQRAYSQVLV